MAVSWWKRLLKGPSRPATGCRPRRASVLLRVEELESREVPTVGITLVNGQLQVTGNGDADVITVDHSGDTTFVNGLSFPDASITSNIRVNAGTGDDMVNVLATARAVVVNGQGGFDRVIVGKAGSTQAILAVLTVTNAGGSTSLDLSGSADPVARKVTLAVNPTTGFGSVTGLTPATVSYKSSDMRFVVVRGGSGGDVFTVANTAANTHPLATVIVSGSGANTINVQRTTGKLLLESGGAADTVNLGLAGSVRGIHGEVLLGGSIVQNSITLNVDDHADTVGRAVTMGNFDVNPNLFTLAGLAPAKISYVDIALRSVFITGGSGGNTFTVAGTGSGGLATNLNTGAGADTVNVQRTTSFLSINGQGGADKVNVGLAGSVQQVQGTLIVSDSGHTMTLNVDDHADTTARTVALTTSAGTPAITGLAPAVIAYRAADVSSLTVSGGSGGNTFTVTATTAALTTLNTGTSGNTVLVQHTSGGLKVNSQGGFDTVAVGLAGSLQALGGALTVTNAGGATGLILDDSADAAARSVTLSVSAATGFGTVAGLAPATISYKVSDLGVLVVKGGDGGNTFTVKDTAANSHALTTQIDSGTGADTVNVLRSTGSLRIEGEDGFDKVNVGRLGSAQGIRGDLFVSNQQSLTSLTLDDHTDATARQVTMNNFGTSISSVAGLAPGRIDFRTTSVGTLTVNGGSSGNTFTLGGGDPAVTVLHSGTGADTVNVQRSRGLVFVAGQGGADKVNVGLAGSVQQVQGQLIISNTGHTTTLNVDDHADGTGRSVTLDAAGGRGSITGLAPAAVTWTLADVKALTVSGGGGGNTFAVTGTAAALTTLNTGTGADTVNVQRTGGALVIHGQNGADAVNVGLAGSLQGILGALTVTNKLSRTALRLDDSADPAARKVRLGVSADTGLNFVAGLAPAMVAYKENDVSSVTLNGGSGGNAYFVQTTPAFIPLTINAGSGDDTINVGSRANTLDGIGALTVNGQGGLDTLNVNDQGSTTPHSYSQTATSVSRTGGGAPAVVIGFSSIESLKLHKGPEDSA